MEAREHVMKRSTRKALETILYDFACDEISEFEAHKMLRNEGFSCDLNQPDRGNYFYAAEIKTKQIDVIDV